MSTVIHPAHEGVSYRPITVGQVWAVSETNPDARWFVLTPDRIIALFAGGADHTPESFIHTYGDRACLLQTATVYAGTIAALSGDTPTQDEQHPVSEPCPICSDGVTVVHAKTDVPPSLDELSESGWRADQITGATGLPPVQPVGEQDDESCEECRDFYSGKPTYKHDLELGCAPTCPCQHDHSAPVLSVDRGTEQQQNDEMFNDMSQAADHFMDDGCGCDSSYDECNIERKQTDPSCRRFHGPEQQRCGHKTHTDSLNGRLGFRDGNYWEPCPVSTPPKETDK